MTPQPNPRDPAVLAGPAAPDKRLATLQALAAMRGITVEPLEGGRYVVSMGLLLREADDLDALVALLERMGVHD